MIRRDQFILRYVEQNNPKFLDTQIQQLEEFIDKELLKAQNIIDLINQDGLTGSSGQADSQYVTAFRANQAIHNNPNVISQDSARTGLNKSFAVWSSTLKFANNTSASTTPWYDLTIDPPVVGEIWITLPENTNKNVALLVRDRYLGPLVAESQMVATDPDTKGFWGVKPIPGNNGTNNLLDPNAVRLYYDKDANRFNMIFKL